MTWRVLENVKLIYFLKTVPIILFGHKEIVWIVKADIPIYLKASVVGPSLRVLALLLISLANIKE